MSKKHKLEEGQIYAIPLSDGSFTVAQLINHFPLGEEKPKGRIQSVDTYAFFNYKHNKEELINNVDDLDLTKPFSIITSSGKPKQYDWELIKTGAFQLKKDKYLMKLDKGGYIDGTSTNPTVLLKPYFGLFPWDGYFKDDYLDEFMLPNAEMRNDRKYLKDYTTEELKELLPPNNVKLIQRLKEEE
jgi:hypothetical protein